MKNIYLLGATGSIGSQVLEIIANHPDEFKLMGISGHDNFKRIKEITNSFKPALVGVKDEQDASALKKACPDVKIVYGPSGLVDVATDCPEDNEAVLINALVGMVGLKPTIAAIKVDRDILLANKETLVVGGHLINELLKKHSSSLLPIDSEHNAIWQLLHAKDKASSIKRLIITASGGSFRDLSRDELKHVTLADALRHPNWSMGNKITIDSATMMNKGFEMIEAAYLFHLDIDDIEAVLHPESIIHGMVEYVDHSVAALLATPDMRMPISYAMFYPNRQPSPIQPLDFSALKALHFTPVDKQRYPLLGIALEAFKKGGSTRTVLNAANEAAVRLFLNKKISFLDIEEIVIDYVREHQPIADPSLEEIYHIDAKIKQEIYQTYES